MLARELEMLETQSRLLEPTAADRARVRDPAVDYAETFLDEIHERKAYEDANVSAGAWSGLEVTENGVGIGDAIRTVERAVDFSGLNPASGGHLGYIPGGGIYYSAVGDYLAAITNRYAGVYYASPGAVRMENALIRWMASVVGYPADAAGNLASGGSIANLAGIVTARDASGLPAREWHQGVIYTTEHAHHCLAKAYRIAGLKDCIKRNVAMDAKFRMDPAALNQAIDADQREGLKPWLVVASAGTTDVGAVDPLDAIGDIARQNRLWFHIDAAYGGFFMLTEEGRAKLAGIEKSDSVVLDPHKGLFLPYGLGAVIVRDRIKLRESHQYTAAYMQDAARSTNEDSPADLSPELTKHFRGLRMWLPLKLHGLVPFRACLREKLLLARYAYEQLLGISGIEVLNEPELSVVAFRYVPKSGDANEANRRIQAAFQKDGRVFISSTTIGGTVYLRFAILAFRTHLATVQTALQMLGESTRLLESGN